MNSNYQDAEMESQEELDKMAEKAYAKDIQYIGMSANITYKLGFKAGYNKANEWHYPSKGELPTDKKDFKSYVVAYYGAKGSIANGKPCWEELCYDTENKRWVDRETLEDLPYVNKEGIVIAWKEIVLPELPKESV